MNIPNHDAMLLRGSEPSSDEQAIEARIDVLLDRYKSDPDLLVDSLRHYERRITSAQWREIAKLITASDDYGDALLPLAAMSATDDVESGNYD